MGQTRQKHCQKRPKGAEVLLSGVGPIFFCFVTPSQSRLIKRLILLSIFQRGSSGDDDLLAMSIMTNITGMERPMENMTNVTVMEILIEMVIMNEL